MNGSSASIPGRGGLGGLRTGFRSTHAAHLQCLVQYRACRFASNTFLHLQHSTKLPMLYLTLSGVPLIPCRPSAYLAAIPSVSPDRPEHLPAPLARQGSPYAAIFFGHIGMPP